ncbi:ADP-ribosylation factor-directed GTPase activating protein isoform b [Bremerella sp. P1]|uniref:ADP-ribosylation factor-directed GTPase activating protein isoform b n=1 Tax=Bremerella sp. P1 TaxID=3026424 RepID=UPI002367C276|nr:ADP-ribosylation factor-directed GTPase activating protein isoform b [Bremerella sp. P1]WDI42913.1 ADP-ribosylation factor-directed GTPase activating protein isoform b [Bremerella sp. P1]
MPPICQRFLGLLFILSLASCRPMPPEISQGALPISADEKIEPEKLRERIDQVLDFTLKHRHLNTSDHAAWQILHGSLAYGRAFPVLHEGEPIPVVDYLAEGGRMNGWTIERGNKLESKEEDADNFGMRAITEPGTRAGQGHYDQWLAVLSQCDVPPDATFIVGPDTFTMTNFVQQVQLDTSRNHLREFSWTLIGLTKYFPTDHSWTDSSGKKWSIGDLAQIEIEQGLSNGACGGTHRLIGLTMALNRRKKAGLPIEGVWADADKLIQESIVNARQYQNPNGALSVNYFQRPGSSPDLAENLGTTGHTLEFLSLALEDEQLQEEWVRRAASYLCEVFERTEKVSLECGALYHAAHGLVLYRERVYGAREYSAE